MDRSSILVTGKNGQLGQELHLLAATLPNTNFLFTDRHQLDITNPQSVEIFFEQHPIVACINAAAYTAVDKAETQRDEALLANAIGAQNLAVQCHKHKAHLVHVSTDYVFDGTAQHQYAEDHPTNPVNYYGQSKLEGEQLVLQHHPSTVILRTSWVYSAFGNNFVKTMLRLTGEKPTINVVNDQFGSPTYAADLAAAILSIITQLQHSGVEHGGVYHFSNDGVISWYDFAVAINQMAGHQCVVMPIPSSGFPTPAKRPAYSAMNKQKIISTFDLRLLPWQESLSTCLKKIRESS